MSAAHHQNKLPACVCVEQVCKAHSGLLGKGLALSHSPTILEALEGNLPLHLQTNEHSFLEDFITCVQNSSGGRLARSVSNILQLPLFTKNMYFMVLLLTCGPHPSKFHFPRWLQPDSYADPQKTSLILNKDDIRCGWPTTVVVQTKDQYGDVVHVPNMKVSVFLNQIVRYENGTSNCLGSVL